MVQEGLLGCSVSRSLYTLLVRVERVNRAVKEISASTGAENIRYSR